MFDASRCDAVRCATKPNNELHQRFLRFLQTGDRICIPASSHDAGVSAPQEGFVETAESPLVDLQAGICVRIIGLSARPDLNGRQGRLIEFDVHQGRWNVMLDDGSGVSLRPTNLDRVHAGLDVTAEQSAHAGCTKGVLCKGARVVIKGLRARTELNGRLGRLIEFNAGDGRWRVATDDGAGLSLKATNVERLVSAADDVQMAAASGAKENINPAMDRQALTRCQADAGCADRHVCLNGPGARSEVNGQHSRLLEFDVGVDHVDGREGRIAHGATIQEATAPRAEAGGTELHAGLSGSEGTLLDAVEAEERWHPRFTDGSEETLKAANLVGLADGGDNDCRSLPSTASHCNAVPCATKPNNNLHQRFLHTGDHISDPVLSHTAYVSRSSEDSLRTAVSALADLQPGIRVRIGGLSSRPDLNGRQGRIFDFDSAQGRWNVVLDDGSGVSLRPTNLDRVHADRDVTAERLADAGCAVGVLCSGATAVIKGLRARAELNGRHVRLIEFNAGDDRWMVATDDGAGLSLKPANLESLGATPADMQLAGAVVQSSGPPGLKEDVNPAMGGRALNERPAGVGGTESHVCLKDPGMRAELNGQLGSLLEFDIGGGQDHVDGRERSIAHGASIQTSMASCAEVGGAKLRAGMHVCIHGLTARADLNGSEATLLDFVEAEEGWHVRLADGSERNLKAANLVPLAAGGDKDRRSSPPAASHCNAEPCACKPNNDLHQRFKRFLQTGDRICIPVTSHHACVSAPSKDSGETAVSSSADLQAGFCVLIRGLTARPDLNGRQGKLFEFDSDQGRWNVVMEDGSGLSLRPSNLDRVYAATDAMAKQPADCSCAEGAPRKGNFEGAAAGLARGSRICIKGVRARPDLNGRHGTLHEFDVDQDRWNIVLDDGSGVALRTANLDRADTPPCAMQPASGSAERQADVVSSVGDLCEGARVCVRDLKVRSELNGLQGSLLEFDRGDGRWRVVMDNGTGLSLRSANLERQNASPSAGEPLRCVSQSEHLPHFRHASSVQTVLEPGTRVYIRGLSARPDLNGQQATLFEYDSSHGRWKVVLDNGSGLSLRPTSVERVGGTTCATPSGAHAVEGPGSQLRRATLDALGVISGCVQQSDDAGKFSSTSLGDVEGAASGFQVGTRIRVTGLSARAELNGQHGSVLEFDMSEQRWKVVMDDGTGLSLRCANLEKLHTSSSADAAACRDAAASGVPMSRQMEDAAMPGAISSGMIVKLVALMARPDLNGQLGVALRFDEASGRWEVSLRDGSFKMMKPSNLQACCSEEGA